MVKNLLMRQEGTFLAARWAAFMDRKYLLIATAVLLIVVITLYEYGHRVYARGVEYATCVTIEYGDLSQDLFLEYFSDDSDDDDRDRLGELQEDASEQEQLWFLEMRYRMQTQGRLDADGRPADRCTRWQYNLWNFLRPAPRLDATAHDQRDALPPITLPTLPPPPMPN